jgi:heme-degrading monooxygenase HmoA
MYVFMSIHTPKPGQADALSASMKRYGAALAGAPGLILVETLRDENSERLVGLTVWESKDAWQASIHLAREVIKDDPFEEWEGAPVEGFRLTPV